MSFKYNEDIFDATVSALLELESQVGKRELNFNKLYSNSFKLMRYMHKYGDNYKSSPNYFNVHIKKMVRDGEIARREELNSRLKIKPIYFSLTEKGRKRQLLKIRHEAICQREKAYLLLLLYCTFGDIPSLPVDYGRNVLENEEQLERFLSEVNLSIRDFKVERVDSNADQYKVIKMVEHTQIRIHRIEYLQGARGLEGRVEYRYMLPGISIRQFLWGIKQGLALEYIPESMSLSEVEECFELLLKEGLIRIVMRYRSESRYDIVNEDLREAMKCCWLLCGTAEMAMRFIWENARSPTTDEREWLELIRGKRWAMIYLNMCYEKMKTREKDKKKKGYRKVPSEIESSIRALYGRISKYFQEINTKYDVVSREFTSPLDVLIKVVYPEFLRNLVVKNEI